MLYEKIKEAEKCIRRHTPLIPRFGIVMGSGLGELANDIEAGAIIDYKDIPHFPVSTVSGHAGQLILGQLAGVPVVAMAGRFHYYEGYSMQEVTLPIRVMKSLGATRLILSNAAGSVNPDHQLGDLVFIKDHINLMPDNPLRGPNDERLGIRFPDMLHAYNTEMLRAAIAIAKANNIRAHTGIYAALTGPNFETAAEYRFLHTIGADLAGMSTVPEVLVGRHAGMEIFAASLVTDKGYPLSELHTISHEEVLAVSEKAAPKMRLVVRELIRSAEF
ncbi:MAG TPA: purine-nucleoside phosphorylase [Bacteroidetes bacterium]|nr:purine-nucleoside phosphorylase [Bacteroidota bacterium]